ncbi:MAG TPA: hypothetical protein VLT13_02655 [Bacteroidota bacterium]|jgi:hypothetical protein|nr:hypothetical protein [Bacteroidota bacterium]
MTMSRESHKCERVTLTLVPRTDERTLLHIPSTFNKVERTYAWRTAGALNYMLVPTRISSNEIKVDLFVDPLRKGKGQLKNLQKAVQDFVHEKIQTEWRGMKLESISRATVAVPPTSTIVRGTIEEILGASFER